MAPTKQGYAFSQGDGKAIWFLGALATIKASSEQTHSAFALQEVEEMGEPAKALTLPLPQPPDLAKLQALTSKYGIELVGPAPQSEQA